MEQTQLSKRVQANKTLKLKTTIEFVASSSRPFTIFMNIRPPKLLLPSVFILCALGTAFSAKPNVILMMADDLANEDLSCYGSTRIKTPCLDQLAKEGIKLTNYYAG